MRTVSFRLQGNGTILKLFIVMSEGRAGLALRSIAQNFRFRFWGVRMVGVFFLISCISFFLFHGSNVHYWCKDGWLDVMFWYQQCLGINQIDGMRQNDKSDKAIGSALNV